MCFWLLLQYLDTGKTFRVFPVIGKLLEEWGGHNDGFVYFQDFLFSRAYGGDKEGTVYLQTLANSVQNYYMEESLHGIYLVVKQEMVKAKQVENVLEEIQITSEFETIFLLFFKIMYIHSYSPKACYF